MKRRDFLSLGLRAAMGAAVFSVVPLSLLSSSKAVTIMNERDAFASSAAQALARKGDETVLSYTWSEDRIAWFYSAECRLFGADYYFGEWVESYPDSKHLRYFRRVARKAFQQVAWKRARGLKDYTWMRAS